MSISEFYSDKYEICTYGGKEYDVFYFESPNILINDIIDTSIATCEMSIEGSTWYTQSETASDNKIYRKGNENATSEQIKIYPYCGCGTYNNSAKRTLIWRYGSNMYEPNGAGTPSYLPDLKINDFVTQYNINITNAETGVSRVATLDDFLNPPENYYVSSLDSMTTFLHNYNTNRFESGLRGIRPNVLISGKTVGGVVDFIELILNNKSVTYDLNTGNEVSSGGGYKLIKDLKSLTQMTPLLKELPVAYNEKTFYSGDVWTLISDFSSNRQTISYMVSFKFVVKILQSIGCYISVNSKQNKIFSDDALKNDADCIIGEMDSNGVPTFKWLTAVQRETSVSPNLTPEWKTSNSSYSPDNPSKQVDGTVYNNVFGANSGGIRYYIMDSTQYIAFNNWLNGDLPDGFEPMKSIVNMSYQPWKSDTSEIGVQHDITIGGQQTTLDMYPLYNSTSKHFLGSFDVPHFNNNYLDYAPYTDITVYIPLCGEIPLPTNIVMGNTINCYIITDTITGSATGIVTCFYNGKEIQVGTKTGTFTQTMPLSSAELGLKKQAELQAGLAVASSIGAATLGVATGNPLALVGGAMGVIASATNAMLASNTNRSQVIGGVSDVINFNMPTQCYIRITSPEIDEPSNYGHTVGYMLNETMSISECSGFTVCNNVDTSGLSCNQSAKDRIKRLLETGIYV